MEPIKFYCLDSAKDTVSVKLSDFGECGPAPILWYFKGMYRIIPLEVVKNAFDLLTDAKKMDASHSLPVKLSYTFHWDDTTEASVLSAIGLLFNGRPASIP